MLETKEEEQEVYWKLTASCQLRSKSPEVAEQKSPSSAMCRSPCQQVKLSTVQEKKPRTDPTTRKSANKAGSYLPGYIIRGIYKGNRSFRTREI